MDVQFNPTEFSLDKGAQLAEIAIPGLDSPLLQFVRGQNEKLTVDLFFDTTETGTGAGATSVTTLTDRIYSLVKIEPDGHAPPICTFIWNASFPGRRPAGRQPATSAATLPVRRREHQAEVHVLQPRGRSAAGDAHADAARVQDARRAARPAEPELARTARTAT